MLNKLNIILAEDHAIVRDGIKMLLETDEYIHVIGIAADGDGVMDIINGPVKADVLLTDIQMPGVDGFTLIDRIKKLNTNIKVVVLSMHNDMSYVTEAFARGASGFLLKECSPGELLFAVKYVARNGQYLSAELAVKLPGLYSVAFPSGKSGIQFTERELEVMRLIGEGMTNNEISDYLFLSKRTVEGHRQSLLEKTGCRNTAVLVKFAVQNGFIK